MEKYTNYKTAVNWLNNSLILCNDIEKIDTSVYCNTHFDIEDEKGNVIDIYQWYLTDCSRSDVEYLERTFRLLFTYSDMLDLFILCVDHFGTAWNGVPCEVLDNKWWEINGIRYNYDKLLKEP